MVNTFILLCAKEIIDIILKKINKELQFHSLKKHFKK